MEIIYFDASYFRKNYQQFYRKSDNKLICLTCDAQYDSTHGMHYHLNNTVCGFGDKQRVAAKKTFRDHYTRDSENKFVCLGCSQKYETIRGVHYHLSNKKCGKLTKDELVSTAGIDLDPLKPLESKIVIKKNYLGLYSKEGKISVCNTCGSKYHSIHGIHTHLNKTKCGFGEKFKRSPKTNYTVLYSRKDDKLICNGCHVIYNSMHGMHYHLNSTKCGFGDKERLAQKRSYQDFYTKEGSVYTCNHCQYKIEYLQGMHRHLRSCDGFIQIVTESSSSPGTVISSVKPAPKLIKTIIYSDNETMNFIGHDSGL